MSSRTLCCLAILVYLLVTCSFEHILPPVVASVGPSQNDGFVTVEVEGRGDSVTTATQDAIANGLRRNVGEYVTSETVIENAEVVEDLIQSFTVGQQVMTEPVGSPRFEGTTVVVVKVSAEPRKINEKFEKAAASAVYMDGETLAAELDFASKNIEKQREILIELTRDLPSRLLGARLIDREGRPIEAGRIPKEDVKQVPVGSHVVALNIKCYFHLASWYRRVEPRLRAALSAVAVRSARMALRIQYDDRENKHPLVAFLDYQVFGAAWRYDWAKIQSSLDALGTIGVGEKLFLVSRARDQFGGSESFDAYVLPVELDVMDTVPRRSQSGPIPLSMSPLGQGCRLLHSATLPLTESLAQTQPRTTSRDFMIQLSGVGQIAVHPWTSRSGWEYRAERMRLDFVSQERDRVVLMSPRFTFGEPGLGRPGGPLDNSSRGTEGFSDVGAYRVELTLDPGQLADLAAVIFDPVMNPDARASGSEDPSPREAIVGSPGGQPGRRKPSAGGPGERGPGEGFGLPNRKRPTGLSGDPVPGGHR